MTSTTAKASRKTALLSACVLVMSVATATADPLLGVQAVDEPLPWFDAERNYAAYDAAIRDLRPNATTAVTSRGRPPMDTPVSVRLSRFRYPAEDKHLDALVRFDMDLGAKPEGTLRVEWLAADGERLEETVLESIPGAQLHFSYRFPEGVAGSPGALRVSWEQPDREAAVAEAEFKIAPPVEVAQAGRIRLEVPQAAVARAAPVALTVGVPFPRGALASPDQVRLVDEAGTEIPVQVKETARWSRFGYVKWIRCDFTLHPQPAGHALYLEYGPAVRRAGRSAWAVEQAGTGFPGVEAGRLRLGPEGLAFDVSGTGNFRTVLTGEAWAGAFVEHARGANYVGWGHRYLSTEGQLFEMGPDVAYVVEEAGPEQTVLRAEGWYKDAATGDRFCRFVNRYVVQRDSQLVRIFHTWIFTGDGNRDTIRNMGWRFPLPEPSTARFLTSFDNGGEWRDGYYLRQHDHDEFTVFETHEPHRTHRVVGDAIPARPIEPVFTGKRAPGIVAVEGDGYRIYVGVQDFWQNFPSSWMIEEDALTFYQWPRYSRPRAHPVHSGDMGNVWRLWFAHEGEALDFRLPSAIAEGPIYVAESGPEPHFAHGRPDSVNAQGVAKTAEFWLLVTEAETEAARAADTLRGLSEETLRAVVDPAWMAASGAYGAITAVAPDRFPLEEERYAQSVQSPLRQVERMGVYGKWIYGDLLRSADLDQREASLYRTFRKAHWGWPFSWIPYVRSGNTEWLRFAQAATRMMTDVAFCHYVSDDLARFFQEDLAPRQMWAALQPYRAIGWHNRNLIPWAGYWGPTTRCYVDQVDYLWDAWYLTGYHRALDVIRAWAEQVKVEEPDRIMRGPLTAANNRARWPATHQRTFLEMYEATFDPWFLAGAQAVADMHLWRYDEEDYNGHFWNAGIVTWQDYAGCPKHAEFVRHHVAHWADQHGQGWASTPTTIIAAAAHGYRATGDTYLLRRLAGLTDLLRWAVARGDFPDHYIGNFARGHSQEHMLLTSWVQTWFPLALGAFEQAGGMPDDPVPLSFNQAVTPSTRLLIRKQKDQALPLTIDGAFELLGPDGQPLATSEEEGKRLIPADAPPGDYTITFSRSRQLRWPVSPVDAPEILVTDEGHPIGPGTDFAQYWFKVPEGVDHFTLEFENRTHGRHWLSQWIVWDPDGNEAWGHRILTKDHDPEVAHIRAEIEVTPGLAGRLWRVTLPARQGSPPFRLDPVLPQAVSHDPSRWFEPEVAATAGIL